jgi:hypothetical protein
MNNISLRDYFAGLAMQALLSNPNIKMYDTDYNIQKA